MNIPPPTRANNAIDEAPIPNVSIAAIISSTPSLNPNFKIINQTLMSRSPRPTTVSPITEPEENAIFNPLLRLSRAPFAVLVFAYVAIFIPTNPDNPEKNPPVRNANGTNGVKNPVNANIKSITNITAKKTPTVLYWRFKYAIAPFLILSLIFAISSVPSGFLFTA